MEREACGLWSCHTGKDHLGLWLWVNFLHVTRQVILFLLLRSYDILTMIRMPTIEPETIRLLRVRTQRRLVSWSGPRQPDLRTEPVEASIF